MKKSLIVILVGLTTFFIPACRPIPPADNIIKARFMSCENHAGAGFFWLDTTCGKVWWASPGDCTWEYYGKPDGAKEDEAGRYIPHENKNGAGLFILDSVTGEGWWTNGRQWKKMGTPRE